MNLTFSEAKLINTCNKIIEFIQRDKQYFEKYQIYDVRINQFKNKLGTYSEIPLDSKLINEITDLISKRDQVKKQIVENISYFKGVVKFSFKGRNFNMKIFNISTLKIKNGNAFVLIVREIYKILNKHYKQG